MSQQAANEFLALLQRTYPAFRSHMPLRIGTRQELARLHPDVPRRVLAKAMACWCRNPAYLKALLAKDAKRYDLDAKPVGPVGARERAHARQIQKQRKAQKAATPQPVAPPAVQPARTAGSANASKPVLSLKRQP